MSQKDFEAICWQLKTDTSTLLQEFFQVKQGYHELKTFMDLLNPILMDIKTLEATDKPILYMVPILFEKLMQHFNESRNSPDMFIAGLAEPIYLALECIKENLISDSHYISLFLNPKLNGQIENLMKQEDLDKLLEKITVECSNITMEKTEIDECVPKKFSSLRKRQKAETTFQAELDEYLAVEIPETDTSFCLLEWWQQNSTRFPRLTKIAKKYHSIPASNCSGNRIFGNLDQLSNDERVATTPENLTQRIIYRSIIDFCL
jgi:hypothetical protein